MSDTGSLNAMPAPELIIPAHGEEMFPVRLKEWARLREKVSALKKKRRQWSNFGWALIGIGASAALSWFPYFAAETAGAPVAVVTLCVAVACLLSGVIALVAAHDATVSLEQAVREVRVHMHDMESNLTDEQRSQIDAFAQIVLND